MVKFSTHLEALAAVEGTCGDSHLSGSLMTNAQRQLSKTRFEARLRWCRRPIRGTGTAIIRCPVLSHSLLVGNDLWIPSVGQRKIQVSKKNEDELIVFKTGHSCEDDIKREILSVLDIDMAEEGAGDDIYVSVIREQVELCPKTLKKLKQKVVSDIARFVNKDKFSVKLMEPKKGSTHYIAFVSFENATLGFEACRQMRENSWYIDGQVVKINPDLKTSIIIPAAIMGACKFKFDKMKDAMESDMSEIVLNCRHLKHGDCALTVQAPTEESLVRIRDSLQKEFIEGDVLECGNNNLIKCLLKRQGLEYLRKVESDLEEILLLANTRSERLHIYGSEKSVTQAKSKINEYLDQLSKGLQTDLNLGGSSMPAGLMKALIKEYPNLHDTFVEEFGLADAIIDYKKQKLSLIGTLESVTRAEHAIGRIVERVVGRNAVRAPPPEVVLPDCVTCMCPVDSPNDLYRLEACGHSYCLACLQMQFRVCVDGKQFPICCAEQSCGEPWVWRDVQACLKRGWVGKQKLADKALDAFVAASRGAYKFCLSPNCPVVYRVTSSADGHEFVCPACELSLCSSCHKPYHAGLSCSGAASVAAADEALLSWKRENAARCKECPGEGCGALIEKTEGCNKMRCSQCGISFCWICREAFDSSQKCYAHLAEVHGGFS